MQPDRLPTRNRSRAARPCAVRRRAFVALTLALAGSAHVAHAQTWNGGGGADTNINTPANWGGTLPAITAGTLQASFGTGGSVATLNVEPFFAGITFNRTAAFTISGPNNLVLRSSNSSGTYVTSHSSAAGGAGTVGVPIRINTTNADANKLFVIRNNRASAANPLVFANSVALATGSTTNFALRYEGVASSLTRFDGPVSGLSAVQQGSNAWAGELVFSSNQALGSTNINIATPGAGIGTPTTNARLVLGENAAHVQSWNNITFNTFMNIVVGGTVSANAISGTGGSISGATVSGTGTLALNSGTLGSSVNVVGTVGLTKQNAGTLTLTGPKTYTGPTTVNGGTLNVAGSLASAITVNAGGTLAGEGSTSASLSFGAGTSFLTFNPATEPASFSAASAAFAPGAIVQLSPTAAVSIGTPYTVLTLTAGTFSGSPIANFRLGSRGTLAFASGNTALTVTPTAAAALTWRGSDTTNPTHWDFAATANWDNAGTPDVFYGADAVTFDDTAAGTAVAVQGVSVAPASIAFSNSSLNFTVTGGAINPTGAVTKSGSGSVTLANNLTPGGAITVSAGSLALNGTTVGSATASGGTLAVGGSFTGPISIGSAGTVSVTGSYTHPGNLSYFAGSLDVPGNLSVAGTLRVDGGRSLTVGGNLSAASTIVGTFNSPGLGTVALTGSGTAALGATSLHRGLLDIGNRTVTVTGAFSMTGSDSSSANGGSATLNSGPDGLVILGGAFNLANGATTTALTVNANIALGSAGLVTSPHGSYPYRAITTALNPAYPNGVALASRISGNVLFGPDTSSGTVVYSGDNTFTAGVHIRLGTMGFTRDAAMGAVPASPTDWFNLATGQILLTDSFTVHANRTFASMYGATSIVDNASFLIAGIATAANTTSTFAGQIVSRNRTLNGLAKRGTGTLVLADANSYTGPTQIEGGVLSVSSISSVGAGPSSLGAPTSALGGQIFLGVVAASSGVYFGSAGTLLYTGNGATVDRAVRSNADGGALDASGSAPLVLTGTVDARAWGLTLTGSGQGVISGTLNADNAGIRGFEIPSGQGGSGYTPGGVTVTISDPTGTGATARALVNPGNGAISFLELLTAGKNYTNPTLSISGSGTGASPIINPQTGFGTGTGSLTKSGSGTWTVTGSVTVTTDVTVNGGLLDVQSPLRPVTGSLVVAGPGATLRLAAPASTNSYTTAGEFAAITVGAPAQAGISRVVLASTARPTDKASVLVTGALTIDPASGFVDLGNNDLIVKGGAASVASLSASVAAFLAAPGTGLGTSSALPFTTLAVFANDGTFFASYDGIALTASDAIVKFTYVGDTNLDGILDGNDLANVIEGFSTGATGWQNGDLNYSGTIDAADIAAFNAAYTYFTTPANNAPSFGNGQGGSSASGAIPEPATLGLLALGAPALLTRRRRTAR